MKTAAFALCAFVAFQHVLFLVVEMFLWKTPRIRKQFGMTEQLANDSAALAKNQGLYNGFLAAGIVWGLYEQSPQILTFFLTCVVVAGVFGAATAKISILFVQGLPGAIALALVRFGLPVLLIVSLASLAGAQDKATRSGSYKSDAYGFTIDAPAAAKLGDEDDATLLELGQAPASVSVHLAVRPKFDIDRLRKLVKGHIEKLGFDVKEEKTVEISGRKALVFSGEGPYKGTPTKLYELVVLDSPRVFTIRAQERDEDWEKDGAALRASVESFRLDAK